MCLKVSMPLSVARSCPSAEGIQCFGLMLRQGNLYPSHLRCEFCYIQPPLLPMLDGGDDDGGDGDGGDGDGGGGDGGGDGAALRVCGGGGAAGGGSG